MLMPLYCAGFSELKDKRKMPNILIKDNEVTLTLRRQENRGKKDGKAERERKRKNTPSEERRTDEKKSLCTQITHVLESVFEKTRRNWVEAIILKSLRNFAQT